MNNLYQTWVTGGSGYAVLQDKLIVYNRMFNEDKNTPEEPTSPNLVCTYNVTDISQETQILYSYGLYCFSSMIVDGVEMDAETYYQFDTVGNHVVEFVLDDPTQIGDYAFWGCSLTSVIIPDSVTSIGSQVFQNCTNLKSFNGKFASEDGRCLIKDGELIEFARAGLTSYIIPNSVTIIGYSVFSGFSSLTSITIPDSVTTIEGTAFSHCSNLTSIIIPNSVTSIGEGAFYGCSSLTSITCYTPTAPSVDNSTFTLVSNDGTLYVPTGSDYSSWMRTDNYYLGKYNWTIQYI